jgi:Myb-like DNA-binding domain
MFFPRSCLVAVISSEISVIKNRIGGRSFLFIPKIPIHLLLLYLFIISLSPVCLPHFTIFQKKKSERSENKNHERSFWWPPLSFISYFSYIRPSHKFRRPWSPEEDAILSWLISKFGTRNWSTITRGIPGQSGNLCPLKWCNQLDPYVKCKPFTDMLHFFLLL